MRNRFHWKCLSTSGAFLCVVFASWLAAASEVGSGQIEADWAVGSPSNVMSTVTLANERETLLERVIGVHVPPLLKPVALRTLSAQSGVSVNYASRQKSTDGWTAASSLQLGPPKPVKARSANQPAVSPSESRQTASASASSRRVIDDRPLPEIELKFRPARIGAPAPVPPSVATPTETAAIDSPDHERGCGDDQSTAPSLGDATSDAASDEADSARTLDTNDEASAPHPPELELEGVDGPDASPAFPVPDEKPLPPLTRQLTILRSRVRGVLNGYYRKSLNSRDHDPWEAMHGMLAYGVYSRIRQGGPRGRLVTSVGWLCYNKPCKGQMLMHVTREGQLRAKYGVGLQGHLGQLLAMLAQCRVSTNYPIHVANQEFTIADLIEAEKETCYPNSELTFKLIALQYYLDLNDTWLNDQGEQWDFPRLVREELAQPIRGAACGGTHRLSGLSLTVKRRLQRGEPLDGEYREAAEFIKKYHQYAFRLQNRDGSLSTSWFQGRGDDDDIDRRIKTTGHILEWLCYSLSDEELRDQRTIRAVSYLANLMYSNYDHEWEVGPVSHATHALLLYDERVFVPYDTPEYSVSYRPNPATATRTRPTSNRR
jgi:hypothetical protein